MRILFFLLLTFFLAKPSFSQQTTKKEMQAQMLEVVNDLKDQIADLEKQIITAKKEDPESVKDLEEQLALLKKQLVLIEGVNKGISGMSEKTFQQANEQNNDISDIPKKDVTRIKQIPDKILSDAELVTFVKKVQPEVEKNIPIADKTKAAEFYNLVKTKYSTPNELNNIASTCWMNGHPETALYIMGKACVSDMSNSNNLNNYAAFLTMAGGEHAALPILQKLNLQYPGNSTILNNIGQAWYGLGEMNNANQYLDSAMHFYGNHSQANQTKSEIQKSEGKTQESIESLKRSIKENYTPEKEVQLEKLGGKLKYEDIVWKYPGPAKPLGIEKFIENIPAYPMDAEDAEINNFEWENYKDQVNAAIAAINLEIIGLENKVKVFKKNLLDPSKQAALMKPYNNSIFKTANRKLQLLIELGSDQSLNIDKKIQMAIDNVQVMSDAYSEAGKNPTNCHNPDGTIDEDCLKRYCAKRKADAVTFLISANTLWHQVNFEVLTLYKEYVSAYVRLLLYSELDRSVYELKIAEIKAGFLSLLSSLHYEYTSICKTETEEVANPGPRKPLPDFDEANCKYKSTVPIPPFFKFRTECNKMTTEIDIGVDFGAFEISAKGSIEENLSTGKYTRGTMEVGAAAGIDEMHLGPLKAEAKVAGAVGIEITEEGLKEAYIKAAANAELGVDAIDDLQTNPTLNAGAETKITWNAGKKGKSATIGGTLSGTGMLSSMSIAGPR